MTVGGTGQTGVLVAVVLAWLEVELGTEAQEGPGKEKEVFSAGEGKGVMLPSLSLWDRKSRLV